MILVWQRLEEWRDLVLLSLNDRLTPSLIARAFKKHPGYISSAPPAWLDKLIAESGQTFDETIAQLLAKRLVDVFSAVRLYHACRPKDIGSFLERGLRPFNLAEYEVLALEIFCFPLTSIVPADLVRAAIAEVDGAARAGLLYLALDDRHLLENAAHYLESGSEYLQTVAVKLENLTSRDHLGVLRNYGTPTVFVADIPLQLLDSETHEYLANAMLSAVFLKRRSEEAPKLDFTVTLRQPANARYIVHHYHPTTLTDSHSGFRTLRIRSSTCPHCAEEIGQSAVE